MAIVRLKIDVSGTVGDQAWREIKQFDQIQNADFGPQFGSGGLSTKAMWPAASAVAAQRSARREPFTQRRSGIGAEIRLQIRF